MAGKVDQARTTLDEAIKATPQDSRLWFESARLSFYMCEFDRALREIRKASELDPKNARYDFWKGHILTFSVVAKSHDVLGGIAIPGLMADARKAYARAVELDPDFHEARYHLINLYIQNPGSDKAQAHKQSDELANRDAVWAARATMLFKDKSPQESVTMWKQVVADHGTRADARAGLADAYQKAGDYSNALAQYAKARELEPNRVEWLFAIARCQQATKSVDAQADTYQQILDMKPAAPLPSRVRAMRYLASVEKTRGNTKRSDDLQKQADALDPRYGKKGAVRDDVPDLYSKP